MARELDDLAFWLPSEFLTDDDLITDFRLRTTRYDDFSYASGNSFGFNSDLSSPGELVTSPTETESEEDDVVSELTRKLAQSTLRNSCFSDNASKSWKLSGSPQSTLCGCKPGPTASPNSGSGFCSPPDAEDYLRRDFLYAAAEEVARMRMIEETAAFYSSKHFPPQAKPRPVAAPQLIPNSAAGFYRNEARSVQNHQISSQLLQAAKIKQMKQQQMAMNRDYRHGVSDQTRIRNGGDGRERGMSMAAWPAVQQPGSGRRAAFLGESGPKKERTGTGVFLPQRFGSLPAETRKKSGCPTASLPEKVVQALNINMDSIDAHLQRSRDYGASDFDYDIAAAAAALKHRNNLIMAQQRRNLATQAAAMNQQHRLPHDWTY